MTGFILRWKDYPEQPCMDLPRIQKDFYGYPPNQGLIVLTDTILKCISTNPMTVLLSIPHQAMWSSKILLADCGLELI
jgi:hypothetical protein